MDRFLGFLALDLVHNTGTISDPYARIAPTDAGPPGLAAHTRWRTIRGVEARVVYFDGCPCWRTAADRLGQALLIGVPTWMTSSRP